MATELPIACTLPAEELPDRLAEMTALGQSALRSVTSKANRAELHFERGAAERLRAVVAAERECCGFMRFDVDEQDDEVVLAIEVPDGAEPALEGMVAAFRGSAVPTRW